MKRIIVLKKSNPWPGQLAITYALWADVPSGRQIKYIKASTWMSAYDDADAIELTNLRSGAVEEKVSTTNVAVNTPIAVIKNILIDAFNVFQDSITNEQSWQFYGTFYDGTSWTTGGI